ncbi:MAG: hypothetical protein P8J78_00160 [Maricaulis sp.]|nr:hypothetical protein [Maricaulis sp.]MDG2042992.1 hypothetical protein [Maricaulis sp.]
MYSMDAIIRFNGADALNHAMDRNRAKAGVRIAQRSTDVNAFLAACGVKGKRK